MRYIKPRMLLAPACTRPHSYLLNIKDAYQHPGQGRDSDRVRYSSSYESGRVVESYSSSSASLGSHADPKAQPAQRPICVLDRVKQW